MEIRNAKRKRFNKFVNNLKIDIDSDFTKLTNIE